MHHLDKPDYNDASLRRDLCSRFDLSPSEFRSTRNIFETVCDTYDQGVNVYEICTGLSSEAAELGEAETAIRMELLLEAGWVTRDEFGRYRSTVKLALDWGAQ